MDPILQTIADDPELLRLVLIAFSSVITVIIVLVILAFTQNREISFWPPRIGPRPHSVEAPGQSLAVEVLEEPAAVIAPEQSSADGNEDLRVFDWMTKRYGLGYNDVHIVYEIDEDGASVTLTRTVEVLAQSELEQLDTVAITRNLSEDLSDVVLDADKLETLELIPMSSDYYITIEDKKLSPNNETSAVLLNISPKLKPGKKATYQLLQRMPSSVEKPLHSAFTSEAEMEDKGNWDPVFEWHDYYGWHVNRPTRHLDIVVIFPKGWRFDKREAEVLLATASSFPSNQKQSRELERVEFWRVGPDEQPHIGRDLLRLEIDYPMIGLIYAVTWLPVTS